MELLDKIGGERVRCGRNDPMQEFPCKARSDIRELSDGPQ